MMFEDGLPLPRRYFAMAAVILGITMAVLDGTIVNLALPGIAKSFHADAASSIWVINAYQIAILALLLPLATLGDLVGYRRVYMGGLALFTLASAACALAPALGVLTLARTIQGVGAAGVMSVNAALVRLIYPRDQLGKGVAINSLVVAAAAVAGPSLAAAILSWTTWPWLFAVNLPLGALVLSFGLRALPENAPSARAKGQWSWLDVALNAAMFGLVFLGADALGVQPHEGARVVSGSGGSILLLAGLAVGVVYIRRQWRLAVPTFPVDLLRIPVFAFSMGASVTAFTAQMLSYVVLPFLFLDAYGHTPVQAGLLIMTWPLAIVVIAPVVGRLIGRIPDGLLGSLGMGLLALGLFLLALLPAHPSDADIVWRMAISGLGFGLFQSPNNHTIVTSAPLHRSGAASGMLGTARLTGQTLGALLVAMIFSFSNPHNGEGPALALQLGAGFALLACVFSGMRLKPKKAVAG